MTPYLAGQSRCCVRWVPTRPDKPVSAPCKLPLARMIELLPTGTSTMRLILLATLGVALLGCAASRLSNYVKPYVGRDIHELSARLGNPTGKQETSGDRVYVWSISSEGVMPKGTDTERSITVQHECSLEVTVSAENVIRSYEVEGSDAGCAAFRRHLSR
jgi:hypothetical protein